MVNDVNDVQVQPAIDLSPVWEALANVSDPEIPVLNVLEMGMIPAVRLEGETVVVQMTPTFAGCPALDLIRENIRHAVRAAGFEDVRVDVVFDPPWTSDRITPEGLRKLKEFGLAPPLRCGTTGATFQALQKVACPYCNSTETTLESIFGPTLCRAIHYCNACRQSFEQFKPV
ncbi:MAG TPA: 1,2-phenylacetyl-CoA epoxidase subunit PaaD [Phycisphaerae bacterium]|nr:1,2-phenylacetyl-CoA epoxidase subunit PaaD [Phycisphaerae bacterium]